MNTLIETLSDLKARGRVKEYSDEPQTQAEYGDYFLTYCLEKVVTGLQPTLAVSRLDKAPLGALPQGFDAALIEVFGVPVGIFYQVYTKRGVTALMVWSNNC